MEDHPFDYPLNANLERETGAAIEVHPTAIVSRKAELAPGVRIDAYASVGPNIRLAEGVHVGPYALVTGRTTVGPGTRIFPFATVGVGPQDLKYRGEETELVIGARNTIREYVNISVGTEQAGGVTRIGDENMIMAYTHIAHDCILGSGCVLTNAVQLAGHVVIEDLAMLSGGVGIHQFVRIGKLAMVAANSAVLQDVPPFALAVGSPARIKTINSTGLLRNGFQQSDLVQLKKAFRTLFDVTRRLQDRLAIIAEDEHPAVKHLLDFVRNSERGICASDE
ncbi:MAG: acyl-ACP--UDP-N-acetylglucosamine O-acyltransferase [Acidobacteria bacterium]|nr:MAG: acyl-ACP--UDP-N-acetylglucosamine O-acyltransferase [Acidobacteriota bacterium]